MHSNGRVAGINTTLRFSRASYSSSSRSSSLLALRGRALNPAARWLWPRVAIRERCCLTLGKELGEVDGEFGRHNAVLSKHVPEAGTPVLGDIVEANNQAMVRFSSRDSKRVE